MRSLFYFILLQETEEAKRKKKRRPPAKPFDQEEIRKIGGDVGFDGDFIMFEGNRYSRKGFLYKNFTMSAIIADGKCITVVTYEFRNLIFLTH